MKLKSPEYVLFFWATFLSAMWTITRNYAEFNLYEISLFFGYITAVFLLQLACLIFVRALCGDSSKASVIWRVLAIVFTTFNIYTLIIIHNSTFYALEGLAFYALIFGMALAFSPLFFLRHAGFRKFVGTFSLVMLAIMSVQFLSGYAVTLNAVFKHVPAHFNFVQFKKRPNIYAIGFDALLPEATAKDIVGITDLPYMKEIKKAGGRIIPNTFAERIPTKRSLSAFLAMDIAYHDSVDKKSAFMRDHVPNPTYELLRHNGYKIQFIYQTSYFGNDRGRLDYYGVAQSDGACKHIEGTYAFMGFCLPIVQEKFKALTRDRNNEYPEFLFERIKQTAKSGEAWFTFAHIYRPGHAKLSFDARKQSDKDEFKKDFEKNIRIAQENMRDLLAAIRENDPAAVLLIFGDHGPLTSPKLLGDNRGIYSYALDYDESDMADDAPMSFHTLVQDRHAVLAAVFPGDFCKEGFRQNPYSNTRLMRDVIKCLAGGQDPLPADYQPNDKQWLPYIYDPK